MQCVRAPSDNSVSGSPYWRRKENEVNFRRTKYERTTPVTREAYSRWDVQTGEGFSHLLSALAQLIEKMTGLLYVSR